MRLTVRRSLTVLMATALAASAVLAVPAEAKKKPKKKGCPAFAPVEPASNSGETAEALEAPVVKITDAATAEAPVVMEFAHGPALWDTLNQEPIVEDTVFFNIQVESKQGAPTLNVFQEWAAHPPSDMDLYMYDATGTEVAVSGSANAFPTPVSQVPGQGTGAWGLESVPGYATSNCAGYTIESRAFTTAGEDMTLSIWLGEPAA